MTPRRPDPERPWNQILDLIEEGRVVPVIGEELLEVEIDGRSDQFYDYLAEQLTNRLGVAQNILLAQARRFLALCSGIRRCQVALLPQRRG